jgi:hypothetical protein
MIQKATESGGIRRNFAERMSFFAAKLRFRALFARERPLGGGWHVGFLKICCNFLRGVVKYSQ